LKLAARRGEAFSLVLIGNDGPIRRRADVATNELKLRSVSGPHKLPRLADHHLVEHLGQLGVLSRCGKPAAKRGIMSGHEQHGR
jgi:hypothetical protein